MRSDELKALFFCVVISVSVCKVVDKWKQIDINLYRAHGSMTTAAKHLRGIFVKGLTAFEYIEDNPDWDLYRVTFEAIFSDEVKRQCKAFVKWKFVPDPFERVVYNTSCKPPLPETY